jgi:Zn-dependent protease
MGPLFTYIELVDLIIITLALSYIFKDSFPLFTSTAKSSVQKKISATKEHTHLSYQDDPLFAPVQKSIHFKSIIHQLKQSALIVAPAIILHELGHKCMALYFGFSATLQADYLGLGIGIFLKVIQSPVLFFIPAYVSWVGDPTTVQQILVAFAGPLVNILLWAGSWYILKYHSHKLSSKAIHILVFTRFVNGLLAIFNLLPIPFFDGGKIAFGLYELLFGTH